MKRKLLSLTSIVILVLVVILINGICRNVLRGWTIDLTEDSLYSLSAGSKNILKNLKEPITLKYFFSKTEGAEQSWLMMYGERVQDLLREYGKASKGKVNVEVYDPVQDSEAEEWAERYGLAAVDTPRGSKIFLGLVAINSQGEEQVIPIFNFARESFLEYDITRIIANAATEKKPIIGIVTPIDIFGAMSGVEQTQGQGRESWFAFKQLSQFAEVRKIPLDVKEIAQDINLLVLFHPTGLTPEMLFAIDQFVMRGGRLIAFVDPFTQIELLLPKIGNQLQTFYDGSNLNDLTKKWGVELIQDKVVGDLRNATEVTSSHSQLPQPFVLWNTFRGKNLNQTDLVTGSLDNLLMAWVGALKITQTEGVEITPLVISSSETQLVDKNQYSENGGEPDYLLRNFIPTGEVYNLAVRIRGKLKSNFTAPPLGEEANNSNLSEPVLTESVDESNVIIVADADMLTERFSLSIRDFYGTMLATPINDNLNFFFNAVENLLGSNDLIGIRSRGIYARPFEIVTRMEIEAQQKWQQQELILQSQINELNMRLQTLQSQNSGTETPALSPEILREIKSFREERATVQKQLRDVRRNLRENIESLGLKHNLTGYCEACNKNGMFVSKYTYYE